MQESVMDKASVVDLRNMTQCSVCQERYVDPRVLPCLHTFCLDCIQHAGSNRRPGDKMSCPLCRKEFLIPEDDFQGLQKDFRLRSLLEMFKLSSSIHLSNADDSADDLANEQVVYCFDCQVSISIRTYFDHHPQHNCCDIIQAIGILQDQVLKDKEIALAWETEVIHRIHEVDAEKTSFLGEVSHAERAIRRKGEDMQKLVEMHLKALKEDLDSLKHHRLEEIEREKDALDIHLLKIQRFRARCERLNSMEDKILPRDVCRSAVELNAEAEKLQRKQKLTCTKSSVARSLEIDLKMTHLEDFLTRNSNNIVGTIQARHRWGSRSKFLEIVASAAAICGIFRKSSNVCIHISGGFGLVAGLLVAAGFNAIAGAAIGLFVALFLFSILQPLLPRSNSMQLLASLKNASRHACGVTYLRHRIYVILTSPPSVVVYPSEAPFFRLQEIPLAQVLLPCDIASCHVTNSFYVTDSGNRCVWKVCLNDLRIQCWLSDMDKPHTLSVSSDGQTLILRDGHPCSSLELYGSDGVMIGCIRLPAKVSQPHHAVETSTGTYMVSHGTWISQTHGFVEVTRDGVVLRSYNSTESLWGILKAIHLLLDPTIHHDDVRHIALDSDDRLLAADWFNDRIMRLDSGFKLGQMHLTTSNLGAGWPIVRMCYVKEMKQMLIVHETTKENRVHVYRLY